MLDIAQPKSKSSFKDKSSSLSHLKYKSHVFTIRNERWYKKYSHPLSVVKLSTTALLQTFWFLYDHAFLLRKSRFLYLTLIYRYEWNACHRNNMSL